ncbi:MAG: hypothetical protein M3P49_10905, partial [Actinomycetota bacterium]|nr:hypothetical protein [Actinomycetota bacterium]
GAAPLNTETPAPHRAKRTGDRMEKSADRRERAQALTEASYGNAGLDPADYGGVVEVFARPLAEHDGDEARA